MAATAACSIISTGGHFTPESPGQFPPESLSSLKRNQVVNISGISSKAPYAVSKKSV